MMRGKKIITFFIVGFLVFSQSIIEIPVLKDVGKLIASSGTFISFAGRFALDSSGNFYIQDKDRGNILRFSPDGKALGPVLPLGLKKKEVSSLKDFYLSGNLIYVIDEGTKNLKVFDLNGKFKFLIKTHDVPGSVGIGPAGTIFVADFDPKKNTIISMYNSRGKYLGGFGMPFQDPSYSDPKKFYQLQRNITIRVSPSGEIGVLSNVLGKFRKYSSTYTMVFEKKIEGPEVPKGSIEIYEDTVTVVNAAVDLAIDSKGRFIVSLPSSCAYIYDSRGNLVGKIGIKTPEGFLSPGFIFLSGNHLASSSRNRIFLLNYSSVEGRL